MGFAYSKLFKLIEDTAYTRVGDEVDYAVIVNNEEKRVYLLFEESRGKRDWEVNFDFPFQFFTRKIYHKQVSCVRCHRGFGKSYKSANDEIMLEFIETVRQYPDYDIIIAGWSYGGAITLLAAEDFNFRTRTDKSDPNTGRRAKVITYGAPKIFNKKSAKYVYSCCDQIVQVAQHNDIVTRVVPFASHVNLTNKTRVGKKFSIVEIFKPKIYHQEYDDESLYVDAEISKNVQL